LKDIALIKLGGSVITFKDRPLEANTKAIRDICIALAGLKEIPFIIVHGGGSFGHYWSVKYDMHTKPAPYDSRGVAVVHESMVALNQIIVNAMLEHGMNPYGLPPSSFTSSRRPIKSGIAALATMAANGVIPVTFGDMVHIKDASYSIFSGDSLMSLIAGQIKPSRVIFATNVDGIYQDMHSKKLVAEIELQNGSAKTGSADIGFGPAGTDVTGGMKRKVAEAAKIASLGMDVMLVNGLEPARIVDAARGKKVVGTRIKGLLSS